MQIGDGTGTYSKATVDADIVVTIGDGSVTLNGAADLETLNILGEERSSAILTLTNSDGATTLAAGIEVVDASARTKAIKITGNELDRRR